MAIREARALADRIKDLCRSCEHRYSSFINPYEQCGVQMQNGISATQGATRPLRRFFSQGSPSDQSQEIERLEQEKAQLLKEAAWLKLELEQYRNEAAQFASDEPCVSATGRIAQIIPPIAGARIRATVSSPSMAGYLFIADSWQVLLSRLIRADSTVLDIGCGCGKMARNLLYHPYVKKYIGVDVYAPNIDFCLEHIAPRSGGQFEFHFLDVYSEAYNPQGKLRGDEVAFPLRGESVDFAFAASLFTHLLERDSRHYLREVARTLSPDGLFLPTIHTEPAGGSNYSGNEIRVDVEIGYFIEMARDAGLRLVERLGFFLGQDALLFRRA